MTARATQNLSELSLDFQDLPVDGGAASTASPATFSQVAATPPIGRRGHAADEAGGHPGERGSSTATEFEVEVDYHGEPQVFTDPDGVDRGLDPEPGCPLPAELQLLRRRRADGLAGLVSVEQLPLRQGDLRDRDHRPGRPGGARRRRAGRPPVANGDGTTTWSWARGRPDRVLPGHRHRTATTTSPRARITEALDRRTCRSTTRSSNRRPAAVEDGDRRPQRRNERDDRRPRRPLRPVSARLVRLGVGQQAAGRLRARGADEVALLAFPLAGRRRSTYLHELAHQWWGNAVTLEHWNDIWFNEGWARALGVDLRVRVGVNAAPRPSSTSTTSTPAPPRPTGASPRRSSTTIRR